MLKILSYKEVSKISSYFHIANNTTTENGNLTILELSKEQITLWKASLEDSLKLLTDALDIIDGSFELSDTETEVNSQFLHQILSV